MLRHILLSSVLLLGASMLTACLGGSGGSSQPTAEPPTDKAQPPLVYLASAAIGVSDLEASLDLYTQGLGMQEVERLQRSDRTEVILRSADRRGSHLVLMDFTDGVGRNVQQNPGKLVFYVADMASYLADFTAQGGRITLPPSVQPDLGNVLVGFGRDTDNNLIEFVGEPDAEHSFFGAFGIGVSDLPAARDFYVEQLGFEEQLFLELPGLYDEYVLQSPVPGDSALVLMNWTNDGNQNYTDNPVKLQLELDDPVTAAEQLQQQDVTVSQFPAPSGEPDLNQAVVGYAADADGTSLELRQGLRSYLAAGAIGVADLDAALHFYTNALDLQEVTRRQRDNRLEVVLQAAEGRGGELVLMAFTDGQQRQYDRNPGKLVFYVNDPDAIAMDIVAAGGRVTLPPALQPGLGAVVGFARDPDNNLVEIVGSPDASPAYLSAFGIGVSDLGAARDFYVEQLGFRQQLFLPIPGMYNEYILQGQGGVALVLMNWVDGQPRNYADNPVKLEIRSMAPAAQLQAISDSGEQVIQTPEPDASRDDEKVAYALDSDGSLLEILHAPWRQAAE
ncbi:VOC family protein [Halopseudomonas salegens]|uniref:Catechol 2,3-dioxygenase n=1 Tax=Halopseudomonas salegens TaxID=1434072 RepID=A0A1H2H551_9GAMM|nr:VOC family protein [Halopseudomonas salegens]SDU26718.1 Catechol 2,3-dioxygenase [Halopseudomonas salegens]